MSKLRFEQLCKDSKNHFDIASTLWVPFIQEVNTHDGIVETEDEILEGLIKRIGIQGSRDDMHFEIAFFNNTPVGIAMFAIDLGTVCGLLEKGYGTVMGFYIHPKYRRKGLGKEFWQHIEAILRSDGASKFYVCPDGITGLPFWKNLGFKDSGKFDPDDRKPIYIKSDAEGE